MHKINSVGAMALTCWLHVFAVLSFHTGVLHGVIFTTIQIHRCCYLEYCNFMLWCAPCDRLAKLKYPTVLKPPTCKIARRFACHTFCNKDNDDNVDFA